MVQKILLKQFDILKKMPSLLIAGKEHERIYSRKCRVPQMLDGFYIRYGCSGP
jgi:hypothetical protein